ncbi:MAG: DNA polymerase Y family protein, partial [Limisphaerales bacterium]
MADGESSRSGILLGNGEARQCGIRTGLTVSQAQALCPALVVKKRNHDLEKRGWEKSLSFLSSFSPRVENVESGTAFLDFTGLNRHQSVETEAEKIREGLNRLGFTAQLGVAQTKSVAQIAAKVAEPYLSISAGKVIEFLAPLPVELLALGPELHHSLAALGISTIGSFAALPARGVLLHFGQEAAQLHLIAKGIDPFAFVPHSLLSPIREELEFEYPVSTLAGLAIHLNPVVERLLSELKLQNRFPGELRLMVKDTEGQTIEKTIGVEAASDRPQMIGRAEINDFLLNHGVHP